MRILGFAIAFLMVGLTFGQDSIVWMDYTTALELQKKDPKPIAIDVYTEWCGWCKKMDATTFSDSSVVNYMNENFYCVKFDAESTDTIVVGDKKYVYYKTPQMRRGVNTLAVELLDGQMSYPSYVFLTPGGEKNITKGWMDVLHWMSLIKQVVTWE